MLGDQSRSCWRQEGHHCRSAPWGLGTLRWLRHGPSCAGPAGTHTKTAPAARPLSSASPHPWRPGRGCSGAGRGGPGGLGGEPSHPLPESAPEQQASAPQFLSGAYPASQGHGPRGGGGGVLGAGWAPPLVSLWGEKWPWERGVGSRAEAGRAGPHQQRSPQRRTGQQSRASLDPWTAPGAGGNSQARLGPALGGFSSPRTPKGAAGLEENVRGAFAKLPKTLATRPGTLGARRLCPVHPSSPSSSWGREQGRGQGSGRSPAFLTPAPQPLTLREARARPCQSSQAGRSQLAGGKRG